MKGVVFVASIMLIVGGVNLIAIGATSLWGIIIGDILLATGACVFSAIVKSPWLE